MKSQSIEPTLVKLNDYINRSVKYTDFTAADKANLVEIFVTHQNTLVQLYSAVFPQSTNLEKNYTNLSVIEKSTLENRKMSMGLQEGDSVLGDTALYQDLLDGDILPSQFNQRNHS